MSLTQIYKLIQGGKVNEANMSFCMSGRHVKEWRYGCTNSSLCVGKVALHLPAMSLENKLTVPLKWEDGWVSDLMYVLWRRQKLLAFVRKSSMILR
jgi:hypothetical protein